MRTIYEHMRICHYNDEEKRLHRYLADRGHTNVILASDADVFDVVRRESFDAAFVGLHPHGLQLIRQLSRTNPDCLVTIITSDANTRMAVEAMKLGAFDYLLSPLNFAEVERTFIMMLREHEGQRERRTLEGQLVDAKDAQQDVRSDTLVEVPPRVRRHVLDEPPLRGRLVDIIAEVEARAIRQALTDHAGNISAAARSLAISRTTLYTKMQEYSIG